MNETPTQPDKVDLISQIKAHFEIRPVHPDDLESDEYTTYEGAYRIYDEAVTDWLHDLEELVRPVEGGE